MFQLKILIGIWLTRGLCLSETERQLKRLFEKRNMSKNNRSDKSTQCSAAPETGKAAVFDHVLTQCFLDRPRHWHMIVKFSSWQLPALVSFPSSCGSLMDPGISAMAQLCCWIKSETLCQKRRLCPCHMPQEAKRRTVWDGSHFERTWWNPNSHYFPVLIYIIYYPYLRYLATTCEMFFLAISNVMVRPNPPSSANALETETVVESVQQSRWRKSSRSRCQRNQQQFLNTNWVGFFSTWKPDPQFLGTRWICSKVIPLEDRAFHWEGSRPDLLREIIGVSWSTESKEVQQDAQPEEDAATLTKAPSPTVGMCLWGVEGSKLLPASNKLGIENNDI